MDRSRRLKRIMLDPEILMSLITKGEKHFEVVEGLPEGTKYVSCFFHPHTGLMNLNVEHESFDPVEVGFEIPTFTSVIKRLDGHTN